MENKFIPPFRVGKKQQRAVLDSQGKELVVFPKGRESYALEYVDFLNTDFESAGIVFENQMSDSFRKSIESIESSLNKR